MSEFEKQAPALSEAEADRISNAAHPAIKSLNSGWQPIETAPKNTIIWAYCFENYQQPVIHTEVVDYGDEGLAYICKSVTTDKFVSVTHWRPLPEPPEQP